MTERIGGGYLMVYKAVGNQNPLPFGGPVLQVVAFSDSPAGPFVKQPKPVLLFACDEDARRQHAFNLRLPLKALK